MKQQSARELENIRVHQRDAFEREIAYVYEICK